jgi:hypothetical protein
MIGRMQVCGSGVVGAVAGPSRPEPDADPAVFLVRAGRQALA